MQKFDASFTIHQADLKFATVHIPKSYEIQVAANL